jgi:CheY-like chemotaxis protein
MTAKPTSTIASAADMPDETSGHAPDRATVLLIDDDPGVLDSLRLLLEAYGYGVLTASDGRKGLAVFQQHAPAVVVTDILMPEQEGIGTIREMHRHVRQRQGGQERLPEHGRAAGS